MTDSASMAAKPVSALSDEQFQTQKQTEPDCFEFLNKMTFSSLPCLPTNRKCLLGSDPALNLKGSLERKSMGAWFGSWQKSYLELEDGQVTLYDEDADGLKTMLGTAKLGGRCKIMKTSPKTWKLELPGEAKDMQFEWRAKDAAAAEEWMLLLQESCQGAEDGTDKDLQAGA